MRGKRKVREEKRGFLVLHCSHFQVYCSIVLLSCYCVEFPITFISNCIINLVSGDPGIPIKTLVKEIEGLYNDLPRWMNVVQNFAPDTIVCSEASRHFVYGIKDPTSFILDMTFWAFKPCIQAFAYCKPIL
ncbi:hypothetical protein Lal_00038608 [Lupinus albus]|nr:hypothetical protein Lal_00038608 [Lupinus albus]